MGAMPAGHTSPLTTRKTFQDDRMAGTQDLPERKHRRFVPLGVSTYESCPNRSGSNLQLYGVIPAKAGIQNHRIGSYDWIPAFAGMTKEVGLTNR
jgi:hypothetical protein